MQAALNGRRSPDEHPAVPVTPEQLAREARDAVAAGARSIHVHPRGDDGRETLHAAPRDATVRALRAACPGIELSVTTGLWIEGDVARRLRHVAEWTELPDLASVNLKEEGAVELIAALLARGIGVEAGIATAADARGLVASGVASRCARLLVEPEGETVDALAELDAIDAVLATAGVTIRHLEHGYHSATWDVISRAARLGRDVRVGLEDTLVLPDGRVPRGNGELVAACVGRVEAARHAPGGSGTH